LLSTSVAVLPSWWQVQPSSSGGLSSLWPWTSYSAAIDETSYEATTQQQQPLPLPSDNGMWLALSSHSELLFLANNVSFAIHWRCVVHEQLHQEGRDFSSSQFSPSSIQKFCRLIIQTANQI
jgi:hypothetical protein